MPDGGLGSSKFSQGRRMKFHFIALVELHLGVL